MRGQTATELAIFGAILIFVVGLLVRQAYNANSVQNYSLRAMRMALSESFKTSNAKDPLLSKIRNENSAARNYASIFLIEDRLAPSAEKFGPTTRTPFVLNAAGSHSQNFFLPIEYGEDHNLPRFDLFVNGQHFVFTLAGFGKRENLDKKESATLRHPWREKCACIDRGTSKECRGCITFYTVVANTTKTDAKSKSDYCVVDCILNSSPPSPAHCCDPKKNLTADQRFDLDRDPYTPLSHQFVPGSPAALRENFTWQWYAILGFSPERAKQEVSMGSGGTPLYRKYELGEYGEGITITKDTRKNNEVDVDGDLKEEVILELYTDKTGIINKIEYMDSQEGDLDMSRDSLSPPPQTGLLDDLQMYSYTREGTYLLLQEGKLYDPQSKEFVRSTQKRDRVDIIQRTFQLSNDTGHLCGNGTAEPWDAPLGAPNDKQNPDVEACNNCFSNANIDKTCFEEDSKILYIRSRVQDLSGRKWITKTAP